MGLFIDNKKLCNVMKVIEILLKGVWSFYFLVGIHLHRIHPRVYSAVGLLGYGRLSLEPSVDNPKTDQRTGG